jgi:hypothetical protein
VLHRLSDSWHGRYPDVPRSHPKVGGAHSTIISIRWLTVERRRGEARARLLEVTAALQEYTKCVLQLETSDRIAQVEHWLLLLLLLLLLLPLLP